MKLTDFLKILAWGIGIIAIISLWIAFPLIFKYWVYKFLVTPPFSTEHFASLGPIGDIFGGLTAFFTSLTLIIVLYSAHLQKRANKDARDAMDKQLQQARNATATQLREARRSTNEQITQAKYALSEQLKQAEEATKQQLALAKETHDAQIQESRNSIFISQFYALLNYKNEKLNGLTLTDAHGKILKGQDIFRWLDIDLSISLGEKFNNDLEDLDVIKIEQEFTYITQKYNNNQTYYELFSYFEIYSRLISLLKSAHVENEIFYWELIRGSMTGYEQCCLFYLAPMWERVYLPLKNCRIFNSFMPDKTTSGYALKFYTEQSFSINEWLIFFAEQHKKTPA